MIWNKKKLLLQICATSINDFSGLYQFMLEKRRLNKGFHIQYLNHLQAIVLIAIGGNFMTNFF